MPAANLAGETRSGRGLPKGNPSSLLPTMLGGSASSQASGAPFRNERESTRSIPVWPPPAHQNNLFNRGYGIYSLFPGPGDNAKGPLYAPSAKSSHSSGLFQGFLDTQRVSSTFFSRKFSCEENGGSEFDSSTNPVAESPGMSGSKLFGLSSQETWKETRSKRLPADDLVFVVKSEAEEANRVRDGGDGSGGDGDSGGGERSDSNKRKNRLPHAAKRDNGSATTHQGGQSNEPDSTECSRILNESRRIEDISSSEVDDREKKVAANPEKELVEATAVAREADENDGNQVENDKEMNHFCFNKEKCNIKVIDLRVDCSGKIDCRGKPEKKYVKTKTPDSSCKSLTVHDCGQCNKETSKPAPIRTLSLQPSNNGGCSRTTPVTFKNSSQHDSESKSQSGNLRISPLVSIKKEPIDFSKCLASTPFISGFNPVENLFNPNGLLLDAVPYSTDSFSDSSKREKESFPSSISRDGQNLFSNRKLDPGEHEDYSINFRNLSKPEENYSRGFEKSHREIRGIRLTDVGEGGNVIGRDGGPIVNSTTSDLDGKNNSLKICSSGSVSSGTPCQVAEVTSASALLSPKNSQSINPVNPIKQESISAASGSGLISSERKKKVAPFPGPGESAAVSSTVGVSLTRQRCQPRHEEMKIPLSSGSPPSVLHRPVQSPSMGAAVYPRAVATCDEGPATVWPTQSHNPPIWQYSAPIDYSPFPPVGFQLIRDPITGHFLLIPASNLEALQRALLWPSYQPTPSQMIIPPVSLQPSNPHLILSDANASAIDFLTPEAIRRDSTQHRILVAAENPSEKKLMHPALIKLEASEVSSEHSNGTTRDGDGIYAKPQLKVLPPEDNLINYPRISSELIENSVSTVPCLTPLLENSSDQFRMVGSPVVSNQVQYRSTDASLDGRKPLEMGLEAEREGSRTSHSIPFANNFDSCPKRTASGDSMQEPRESSFDMSSPREPEDDKKAVLKEIQKGRESAEESLNVKISTVPDVNIKKELVSPSQVDLSGLELLSNSIEQLMCDSKTKKIDFDRKELSNDACEGAVLLQNLKNGFRQVENEDAYGTDNSKNLGGLGLLCALAEQRFREEIDIEILKNKKLESKEEQDEVEKEREERKREEEESIVDELGVKGSKGGGHPEEDSRRETRKFSSKQKRKNEELEKSDEEILPPSKKLRPNDSQEEEDEEKSIEGMSNRISKSEDSVCRKGPGRPKKSKCKKLFFRFSTPERSERKSKEMSPPILEKQTDFPYKNDVEDGDDDHPSINSRVDISKPPTLTPSAVLEPVPEPETEISKQLNPVAVRMADFTVLDSEAVRKRMKIEREKIEIESKKRKFSDSNGHQQHHSSSKKRKVGRPKKHHLMTGNQNPLTETIVAKKPKSKPVYPFLPVENPLPVTLNAKPEEVSREKCCWNGENRQNFCANLVPVGAKPILDSSVGGDEEEEENEKSRKIRPKLKAEVKLKESTPPAEETNPDVKKRVKREENCSLKSKAQKKCSASGRIKSGSKEAAGSKETKSQSCVLTSEHIKSEKFPVRTLTAMGGLFYAGQLSAIRAPDVYGITIDGERGNRPHIYSREEILRDSILEVKPENAADLIPGTRCCAYWSEQYRCLYPGTVSAPASPDPELDDKFVNVEFDDGDSGRINIDDIRLLPEDYPIVEYDPNPLQSLTKRKRRISGASVESHSKERKSTDSGSNCEKTDADQEEKNSSKESIDGETVQVRETVTFLNLESERKHLKKKRREKLKRLQSLSIDGKRKHKKHKCSEEHRHRRHRRKHRKHKHRHGKKRNGEGNEERNLRETESVAEEEGESRERTRSKKKLKKGKIKSKPESDSIRKTSEEKNSSRKPKKCKKRTESVESRSKMAAFLPARQLWGWSGKGHKRPGAKGRARKEFYKTIQRGKERIMVGDCAVFLSTGRPDRPYIGRIESMWESWGTNMIVRVKWFYHPEETVGCPATLEYPGALFESPHVDENDVQTISHKCEVLPLKEYTAKLGNSPRRYEAIYDNNDIYYLAGYYDPTNTTLKIEPGVK